jgi:rhodanese-related sulfurtransferase/rubrerythrin
MLIKKLFTPVRSLEAEEARAYIAEHPEGTFTILDVRQPWEYEEAHLPGAKLIPLPQLHDAYKELDPEKPVIVHCAIGGRSRVAAQLLSGLGFREVYNLAGGIRAFQGHKVAGPQELHLDLVRGDETPGEIIRLAYGLEQGLQFFYDRVAARTPDPELAGLCRELSGWEVQHQQRLAGLYAQAAAGEKDLAQQPSPPERMEGGLDIGEFMARNASWLETVSQILELALMLETQALDLYLRLARKMAAPAAREVLWHIGQEEKTHLARLAHLQEEKGVAR